jgi:simple sugar transport system ATP-binding protein
MVDDTIVLEAKDISKQFPGVLANDHVNFDLRKADRLLVKRRWKNHLMNILYGIYMLIR